MNILKANVNLNDEKERSVYFHEMAENSRTLELLLNTCYKVGIIPASASKGHGKDTLAYIILVLDKKHLSSIGKLLDLVEEIPDSEFNIKSEQSGMYAEMTCDTKDSEQLFTRIKEIIEEANIDNKHTYNYTVMSTVYNIAKIVREVLDADILFAVNEKLYERGKCGLSIFRPKQIHKINTKKADNIEDVIYKLKEKSALSMPVVFFSTFEELRNFYFELDEIVYSKDLEGDTDGQ